MTDYKQIDCQELQAILGDQIALVDIRRAEEWQQTGIIADSCLLTFFDRAGNAEPAAWLQQLNLLVPQEQAVALICRSGYRSNLVGDFLCQLSERTIIYNLSGGILAWLAAGLPVEKL